MASTDVLIVGTADRNRAIHGDVVAVELYPEAQWKGRISSLRAALRDESTAENDMAVVKMPTGRIVGVLERNWRPFVCTLQEGEEEKHATKAREHWKIEQPTRNDP